MGNFKMFLPCCSDIADIPGGLVSAKQYTVTQAQNTQVPNTTHAVNSRIYLIMLMLAQQPSHPQRLIALNMTFF